MGGGGHWNRKQGYLRSSSECMSLDGVTSQAERSQLKICRFLETLGCLSTRKESFTKALKVSDKLSSLAVTLGCLPHFRSKLHGIVGHC